MDRIDTAWAAYFDTVFTVAAELFEQHVKPYCDKHGYRFYAGNGTWCVGKEVRGVWRDARDIPGSLLLILCKQVDGMPGNDLGSLMPSKEETCQS